MPDNIIFIVDQIDFWLICRHSKGNDINAKIAFYSDACVEPNGIVSYDERMNEGRKRYRHHPESIPDKERQTMVDCGKEIEKQIFAKCKIKPEDINDATIKPIISGLRDFVIE